MGDTLIVSFQIGLMVFLRCIVFFFDVLFLSGRRYTLTYLVEKKFIKFWINEFGNELYILVLLSISATLLYLMFLSFLRVLKIREIVFLSILRYQERALVYLIQVVFMTIQSRPCWRPMVKDILTLEIYQQLTWKKSSK